MSDSRPIHVIVRLYFLLAVPLLLVLSGARLLLSEQFLHFEYRRPGFPEDAYGFDIADRIKYGPYAINYLFNGEAIDYLASLRLPAENCWNSAADAADCPLFSERELRHMADVKHATTLAFALAIICAVVGLSAALAGWHDEGLRSDIAVGMRRGCKLTLLIIASLAIVSLAAWDRAFDAFHDLFFATGTWRFPFSDSLIRLYPEQLFIDAALLIVLFVSLSAVTALCLLLLFDRGIQRQT